MKRRPRFTVYQAADGWRWRLIAGNGRIVATGEAHTRKADAERATDTVRGLAAAAAHPPRNRPGRPRTCSAES